MNDFSPFARAVEARFNALSGHELYLVDTGDLFETYLAAFPEGTNPIFRERTEHDCSCCKHFVRRLGGVVAIIDGEVATVWDVSVDAPYDVVAAAMRDVVRQAPILHPFRTKERQFGNAFTNQLGDDGKVIRWSHFVGRVQDKHHSTRPDEVIGRQMTAHQVLRRGLEELKLSAMDEVIDLIDANAIYRGEEHRGALAAFRDLKRRYDEASDRFMFVWLNLGDRAALFRNTVIGTLIVDLSEGMDIERAVRAFEAKVAPANYKRPTALITPKMIDNAMAKLADLGLESAVDRRFARLADVSVNNVLFVDNSVQGQMRDGLAGKLMEAVKPGKVEIKDARPISVEDFFATIVPQASTISLLVENRHQGNFVSLTAPVEPSPGRLFKWGNDFAWSYDGDVADSIKARVKRAGGNVDAKLRISLAWSNTDDLDLHCRAPGSEHIYFGNKAGILDVDMNAHSLVRDPVENLSWNRLADGEYTVWVNQYHRRESVDVGFTIQFVYGERVEEFRYDRAIPQKSDVPCFTFKVERGEVRAPLVNGDLVGGSRPSEKWGVTTETLSPVDTILLSPNHWDGQGVGNRHWFFILKGCKNPESARGIYNEFLRPELEPHRKVFEIVGAKTKCPPSDEQLSGVGFSSTRGDTVTAVVKGPRINQAFNIKF